MAGLDAVKGPHWSQILALYGAGGTINEALQSRSQVQLKDKARNLKLFFLKSKIEVPYYLQFVTGELKSRAPGHASHDGTITEHGSTPTPGPDGTPIPSSAVMHTPAPAVSPATQLHTPVPPPDLPLASVENPTPAAADPFADTPDPASASEARANHTTQYLGGSPAQNRAMSEDLANAAAQEAARAIAEMTNAGQNRGVERSQETDRFKLEEQTQLNPFLSGPGPAPGSLSSPSRAEAPPIQVLDPALANAHAPLLPPAPITASTSVEASVSNAAEASVVKEQHVPKEPSPQIAPKQEQREQSVQGFTAVNAGQPTTFGA